MLINVATAWRLPSSHEWVVWVVSVFLCFSVSVFAKKKYIKILESREGGRGQAESENKRHARQGPDKAKLRQNKRQRQREREGDRGREAERKFPHTSSAYPTSNLTPPSPSLTAPST